MALTGLEIFKLLPKTNCKECGVPTCLAFAMQLAQKKANLEACPYVSEQAKEIIHCQQHKQRDHCHYNHQLGEGKSGSCFRAIVF